MTEWNAGDYSRHSSLQQAMAEENLAALKLAGSERILDLGCGDGRITAQIAKCVPRGAVIGIDPSQNMIRHAADHFRPPEYPNIRFECGDARTLPHRNEFDLAVSFNALHWVPEQETALLALRAALKNGGRAFLRFVGQGTRRSLEDVLEDVRKAERWRLCFQGFSQPFAHFSVDEYRGLAERAGFHVQNIDLVDKAWDFKTREAFAGFCQATFVVWMERIPEADRNRFVTDVLDNYRLLAANTPAEANTFKFYQLLVELVAPRTEPET